LLPAVIWVWMVTGNLEFRSGGILADALDPKTAPVLLA